jgi:hypothetical protein
MLGGRVNRLDRAAVGPYQDAAFRKGIKIDSRRHGRYFEAAYNLFDRDPTGLS